MPKVVLASTQQLQSPRNGLQYKVTQLASSEEVLHDLVDYFKTGKVHIDNRSTGTLKYQVQDLVSIRERILPHFQEYPLQTSKALDYKDWSKAVDLLTNKWHYKSEGKQLLFDIKESINNARPKADRWNYLNDPAGGQVISLSYILIGYKALLMGKDHFNSG